MAERGTSSIIPATCPRCGGSLELQVDHDRFFRCEHCGTSLEDSEYGKGKPQVVNITVVRNQPKPLSTRAKVGVYGALAALAVVVAAAIVLGGPSDATPDRISAGTVRVAGNEGDPHQVLATGRTMEGQVRAVYREVGGTDGVSWSVEVARSTSSEVRAAVGADTGFVLVDRKLFGLDLADGTERFDAIDLPNGPVGCAACFVATGAEGQYITVVLDNGLVQSYAATDGSLVSEVAGDTFGQTVLAVGDRVVLLAEHRQHVEVRHAEDLTDGDSITPGCSDDESELDERIEDLAVGEVDGELLIWHDDCVSRWSVDPVAERWKIEGISPLGALPGNPAPVDVVRVAGSGLHVVDLTRGELHRLDVREVAALQSVGRSETAVVVAVREGAVWSLMAVDPATGNRLWNRTPPGGYETYLPVNQQFQHDQEDARWTAGFAGGVVHYVRHEQGANSIFVQQIDPDSGEPTDEVEVSYASGSASGVRNPVVLGFTAEGVVITLDDTIHLVDTATGEIVDRR